MGLGKWFKKQIKSVGKIAKKAAPVIGLIPGIGTLAAAGIGGLGGALSGGGWKGALKGAGSGALGGVLAGKGGSIPGIGKYLGEGSKLGGVISAVGSPFGSGQSQQTGGGGITGFLRDNSDLIMGGINAYQNAQDQTRRDRYTDEMLGWARDDRARNQALYGRIQGLDPTAGRPNLDATFADESNPFYRAPSRPQITGLGTGASGQPERGGTTMSRLRSGELSLPSGPPIHTGSGGNFGEGGRASGLGRPGFGGGGGFASRVAGLGAPIRGIGGPRGGGLTPMGRRRRRPDEEEELRFE